MAILTESERKALQDPDAYSEETSDVAVRKARSTARKKLRNLPEHVETALTDIRLMQDLLEEEICREPTEWGQDDVEAVRSEFVENITGAFPSIIWGFTYGERAELVRNVIGRTPAGRRFEEELIDPVRDLCDTFIEGDASTAVGFVESVKLIQDAVENGDHLRWDEAVEVFRGMNESSAEELKDADIEKIRSQVHATVSKSTLSQRDEDRSYAEELLKHDSQEFNRRTVLEAVEAGAYASKDIYEHITGQPVPGYQPGTTEYGGKSDKQVWAGISSHIHRICSKLVDDGLLKEDGEEWRISDRGQRVLNQLLMYTSVTR